MLVRCRATIDRDQTHGLSQGRPVVDHAASFWSFGFFWIFPFSSFSSFPSFSAKVSSRIVCISSDPRCGTTSPPKEDVQQPGLCFGRNSCHPAGPWLYTGSILTALDESVRRSDAEPISNGGRKEVEKVEKFGKAVGKGQCKTNKLRKDRDMDRDREGKG